MSLRSRVRCVDTASLERTINPSIPSVANHSAERAEIIVTPDPIGDAGCQKRSATVNKMLLLTSASTASQMLSRIQELAETGGISIVDQDRFGSTFTVASVPTFENSLRDLEARFDFTGARNCRADLLRFISQVTFSATILDSKADDETDPGERSGAWTLCTYQGIGRDVYFYAIDTTYQVRTSSRWCNLWRTQSRGYAFECVYFHLKLMSRSLL